LNKLSIIVPILAGIGLVSSRSDTTEQAVVTVTQRFDPVVPLPVGQPQKTIATPSDRASLVRELQRELKRVGCYLRDINGIWTMSTRDAMKAFINRVNARLPVDEPDLILLALVQGYQEKACGRSCPAGQGLADDGRCQPNSIITNVAKKSVALASTASPPPKRQDRSDKGGLVNPVVAQPAVPAPAEGSMATPSSIAEQNPPLQDDHTRLAAVAPPPRVAIAPTMPKEHLAQSEYPRTLPSVGVYDHRSRPYLPRQASRQADLVRSFFRSVKRALAPWGIR
jgi:peptidoglycan hydrolase-like protein with peptidoglycan-binding domain